MSTHSTPKLCACGCGSEISQTATWHVGHANRTLSREPLHCLRCGKEFPRKNYLPRIFCSDTCYNANRAEYNNVQYTCPVCDKVFTAIKSSYRVCCSRACTEENKKGRDRFWSRVAKSTDHWKWLGACTASGYGHLKIDGVQVSVHRYSWELHYGPIPEGLFVCHKCDVRNCLRPDHLFLGTAKDNMQDALRKGKLNHGTKLNIDKVRAIRVLIEHGGMTNKEIGDLFDVERETITCIRSGRTWNGIL